VVELGAAAVDENVFAVEAEAAVEIEIIDRGKGKGGQADLPEGLATMAIEGVKLIGSRLVDDEAMLCIEAELRSGSGIGEIEIVTSLILKSGDFFFPGGIFVRQWLTPSEVMSAEVVSVEVAVDAGVEDMLIRREQYVWKSLDGEIRWIGLRLVGDEGGR
jgi:hypothetical protein